MVQGVDFVLASHDHRPYVDDDEDNAFLNSGSHARNLAEGTLRLTVKDHKVVLSLLTGIFVPRIFTNIDFNNMDDMQLAHWVTGCMNAGVIISCLLTVGLGWGVWRRIKTIQH